MIGTLRWNFVIALVVMILTFLFSLANNLLLTSLIRSLYSLILVFMAVLLFRWLLGTVIGLKDITVGAERWLDDEISGVGQHINATTPDEDESLNQIIKGGHGSIDEERATSFTALNPPRLTAADKLDPEELANALRHLSEE